MQQSAVPRCAILSVGSTGGTGCETARVHHTSRRRAAYPFPFFVLNGGLISHLIVARGTTACSFGTVGIDGTVGIERWGGARGDAVSLWAAARDSLFLGRSRCCIGGAQNNGSGQRNYRPDPHFRLLVRSGVIAALLSTQTPTASDHSINHKPSAMDQCWQAMVVLAVAEAQAGLDCGRPRCVLHNSRC